MFTICYIFSSLLSLIIVGVYCQCFYTGTCYTEYDRGVSYRGQVTVSRNGSACIPWNHHLHAYTPDRFRFEGLESNYCRNPAGRRPAPWCYTSPTGVEEISWELCAVPVCNNCLFRGVQMKLGDRFHDGCSLCVCQNTGLQCLECPGPVYTTDIGCYVKFNNQESFPKCCSRLVCHGKDPEFVMDEYFTYLQLVLRQHQQQQQQRQQQQHNSVPVMTSPSRNYQGVTFNQTSHVIQGQLTVLP